MASASAKYKRTTNVQAYMRILEITDRFNCVVFTIYYSTARFYTYISEIKYVFIYIDILVFTSII